MRRILCRVVFLVALLEFAVLAVSAASGWKATRTQTVRIGVKVTIVDDDGPTAAKRWQNYQ